MSLRWLLPIIMTLAITGQAIAPSRRLVTVLGAAGLCLLLSATSGGPDAKSILAGVPWDVLVILGTLGALSQLLAEARTFERVAVLAARWSRGDPRRLYGVVAVAMYAVSALVNNLTALLLVLPVMLVLLRLVSPTQRYITWSLGLMLVACNLGGAATPIGDFPAILLLGAGRMAFAEYLPRAAAATSVALAVLLVLLATVVRPAASLPDDPLSRRLTLRVALTMHRGIGVDRRTAGPALGLLALVLVAWAFAPPESHVTPELVSWLGAGLALALAGRAGEQTARRCVDGEAVLFLLALFVMVGAVRATGLFEDAGRMLLALPVGRSTKLVAFLVVAAVLTGLFSAGPSMAALLEVADVLAREVPGPVVYVGIALSVCAGSSLFLTAATAGPLAQVLVERAALRDAGGNLLVFDFREFARVGALSFVVILAVGIGQALLSLP